MYPRHEGRADASRDPKDQIDDGRRSPPLVYGLVYGLVYKGLSAIARNSRLLRLSCKSQEKRGRRADSNR